MKLNYKRTILIGMAFLSVCAFWQMYDNVIPLILQNTFHLKETEIGVIMAMDNVLALFLLPLFGALSDKVDTRFGKRIPFIVVGTIMAAIFIMILPIADRTSNQILFIVVLFAVLISMGFYRSPAVALMPDLTPNVLRSKANAVINLMGAVGSIYTLIMIKLLVKKGTTPDYMPLFTSIVALMVIAVGILVITIREKKISKEVAELEAKYEGEAKSEEDANLEGKAKPEGEAKPEVVVETKKERMPKDVMRSLIFLLAAVFLWFTAYNAVTTAFSRYTDVVWHLEGGGFADCLMVATVAAILSYIPIGMISSKIGRKKTILIGIVVMSLCYFAAIFAGHYTPLINVAFALIGFGWASINVNSYPMVVEMSKGADIGKFTGTYYTFSMAAQIVTPILSGYLLEHISYHILFPYALCFSLAAFLAMTQVRHGDTKPMKKKSRLEHFDFDD